MTERSAVGRAARTVQAAALAAGSALVLCGLAAFAVFPARRGFDLVTALVNLVLGALLLCLGRRRRGGGRRWLPLGAALAAAPIVLFYGLMVTLHEIGEIVVVRTAGDGATARETRVAVLDWQGSTWVGADDGARRWVRRLRANPRIELLRGGVARCQVAVPVEDPDTREEVFRRIEEKYLVGRLAAALGRPLFLRESDPPDAAAVAFRLDPC